MGVYDKRKVMGVTTLDVVRGVAQVASGVPVVLVLCALPVGHF
jgi:hypothetical protein